MYVHLCVLFLSHLISLLAPVSRDWCKFQSFFGEWSLFSIIWKPLLCSIQLFQSPVRLWFRLSLIYNSDSVILNYSDHLYSDDFLTFVLVNLIISFQLIRLSPIITSDIFALFGLSILIFTDSLQWKPTNSKKPAMKHHHCNCATYSSRLKACWVQKEFFLESHCIVAI